MSWHIETTIYELKGNLSRFIRALSRGDVDCVLVRRYGRLAAMMVPLGNRNIPALPPETKEDLAMRRRSVWVELKGDDVHRRPPPPPKIF